MKVRPLFVGLVTGLLGVALLLLYLRRIEIEASGGRKVQILVALETIPRGKAISETMLGTRVIPIAYLDDRVVRLKDAKGLRHLALLLASPGVGFHALEIVAAGEGTAASADSAASAAASELSVRSGGQSGLGALLDPQAKAAYRQRLEDLQETIDEAETMNDPERAALARAELDEIAQELAGAIGLGGRDRPAGSDAERARVNATRAIRATLRRLEEHDPRLGRLLARSIRTGTVCIYEPDPDNPIVWTVEP